MTLLEKALELNIKVLDGDGVFQYCPSVRDLASTDSTFCKNHTCAACWGREYEEPETVTPADPEPMRHFATGAVRDAASTDKGRYDLLPWGAIHALAQHVARGAEHYGERNVDKGIPQHSLIDSAVRHLSLYIQGDPEPYHLVAALWNIAWACEQEAKRPELIDLPERTEASGRAI